jgi:hypothetical protein
MFISQPLLIHIEVIIIAASMRNKLSVNRVMLDLEMPLQQQPQQQQQQQ